MKRLLLIGSNGLLGSSLVTRLRLNYDVTTVTKRSVNSDFNIDFSSKELSYRLLKEIKPDLIVNLAALTSVDVCESNINLAYKVNTSIAENIAAYCHSNSGVFVVHLSTDHLYDKNNSNENDVVIYNNYAMTKYCAEKCFSFCDAVILRTNFFGKSFSQNSLGLCQSIYNEATSGHRLKLFHDVFFSPLSIGTLCDVIAICLEKKISGVYNVGSKNGMSKSDFLKTFLTLSHVIDFNYECISIEDAKLNVRRPKDMRMDVRLFEKTYRYKLPSLISEIESVADEFKNEFFK